MEFNEPFIRILSMVFITVILILIISRFILHIIEIRAESAYLTSEIKRSFGVDRKKWIRRKWELWLSLLPFFKY